MARRRLGLRQTVGPGRYRLCMADLLLTVPQVAEEFQVTDQTIRNWIDSGVLPAVRIGRAFRIKRSAVDELLDRATAESPSLATRRDVWTASEARLPVRKRPAATERGVWDGDSGAVSLTKP
jgi:excisionase family DNA binding protein